MPIIDLIRKSTILTQSYLDNDIDYIFIDEAHRANLITPTGDTVVGIPQDTAVGEFGSVFQDDNQGQIIYLIRIADKDKIKRGDQLTIHGESYAVKQIAKNIDPKLYQVEVVKT